MNEYPLTLHHPQHTPAVVVDSAVANNFGAVAARHGAPERYPDVTVHDEDQEERYRARGYLRVGERPPAVDEHLEYPKILSHPDHVEGAKATKDSVVQDGRVVVVDVPARPEKYPDVTVHSRQQEDEWAAKGYRPAGQFDFEAVEHATYSPGELGDEYPRWEEDEDGNPILVDDPNKPVDESRLYPMMVYAADGTELGVANNAADAAKLKARGSSKHEPAKKVVAPVAAPPAFDAAEWAEFQAFKQWKAAQAAGKSEMVAEEAREPSADPMDDLRKQAADLGITPDRRWSAKTLQREIDLALSK